MPDLKRIGAVLVMAATSGISHASLIGCERGAVGTFWSIDLSSGTHNLFGSGTGFNALQDFEYAPNVQNGSSSAAPTFSPRARCGC